MYHRLFYTFVKCYLDILCYCLTKRICKLSKNRIISKHLMLLFNTSPYYFCSFVSLFQNISCYCLTVMSQMIIGKGYKFQNISCYCLTKEKSLFLNRFFTKKNDFISFFNIFTNPLTNFNLS